LLALGFSTSSGDPHRQEVLCASRQRRDGIATHTSSATARANGNHVKTCSDVRRDRPPSQRPPPSRIFNISHTPSCKSPSPIDRVGACLGATVQKQPISLHPTSSTSISSTDEAHTSQYPVTPWNTSCPDGGLHVSLFRLSIVLVNKRSPLSGRNPTSSTSISSTDEAHTSQYPMTPWNTSCPDGGLHLIRLRLLPRYCCMLVARAQSATTSPLHRRCLQLLRTEFTILNQLKSSSTYRLFRGRTPPRICYSSTSARLFRRGTPLRIRVFAISNK